MSHRENQSGYECAENGDLLCESMSQEQHVSNVKDSVHEIQDEQNEIEEICPCPGPQSYPYLIWVFVYGREREGGRQGVGKGKIS